MKNSKKTKRLTKSRKTRVITLANELRDKIFPRGRPIDAEKALDSLYDLIPNFDWFVGDEHFSGMKDVVAYAKFDDGRQIFLKEAVYDALSRPETTASSRAAFIVCHEIAHIILHFRSRKKLARNKLGSTENYKNEELKELEANLFAGSFMIPTAVLDFNLSDFTVARHFRTSFTVAARAKREAEFYQQHKQVRDQ